MKKCKNCKEPFTPIRSTLERYCQKDECLRVFVAEAKEKAWKKKKAVKKEELMTIQDYVKIAQQVFNKYIRLRDKDKGCISCGKPLVGKFDAGHFYNANNHWYIRFHPDNVHGQCVLCNQHKHGNLLEYRKGLIERIGFEQYKSLEAYAEVSRKYEKHELKEIISTYKQKIKNLE
jgi:hypothetical protein